MFNTKNAEYSSSFPDETSKYPAQCNISAHKNFLRKCSNIPGEQLYIQGRAVSKRFQPTRRNAVEISGLGQCVACVQLSVGRAVCSRCPNAALTVRLGNKDKFILRERASRSD